MGNELARRDETALAQNGAGAVVRFEMGPKELQVFQATYCKDFQPAEVNFAIAVCRQTGLDPFKQEIYFWRGEGGKVVSHVAINGWVRRASETGRYQGYEGPYFCGPDGIWKEVWLDDRTPPVACMIKLWWHGCRAPITGIAKYSEFVRRLADGKPNKMWASMPTNQLQKCAFVNALKKAPNNTLDITALVKMDDDMGAPVEEQAPLPEAEVIHEAEFVPATPTPGLPPKATPSVKAQPVAATETKTPNDFSALWEERGLDKSDRKGMKDYLRNSLGREPVDTKAEGNAYYRDVAVAYADLQEQPETRRQAEAFFMGDDDALLAAAEKALGYRPASLMLMTSREYRLVLDAGATPADANDGGDDLALVG